MFFGNVLCRTFAIDYKIHWYTYSCVCEIDYDHCIQYFYLPLLFISCVIEKAKNYNRKLYNKIRCSMCPCLLCIHRYPTLSKPNGLVKNIYIQFSTHTNSTQTQLCAPECVINIFVFFFFLNFFFVSIQER